MSFKLPDILKLFNFTIKSNWLIQVTPTVTRVKSRKVRWADNMAKMRRQTLHTEFSRGNLLQNVHLEDRGDWEIPLRRILVRRVVKMGRVQIWLKIASIGGLW
jgi:hypothetical protein